MPKLDFLTEGYRSLSLHYDVPDCIHLGHPCFMISCRSLHLSFVECSLVAVQYATSLLLIQLPQMADRNEGITQAVKDAVKRKLNTDRVKLWLPPYSKEDGTLGEYPEV